MDTLNDKDNDELNNNIPDLSEKNDDEFFFYGNNFSNFDENFDENSDENSEKTDEEINETNNKNESEDFSISGIVKYSNFLKIKLILI